MPTYDYECDACGHKYELYQSIMAEPEKKCPACSKKKARRLIGSGAAVVFKGSGFYQTDYRSESYKKSASAYNKSSSSGNADKGESKSDSGSGKSDNLKASGETTKKSESKTSNTTSEKPSKPKKKD